MFACLFRPPPCDPPVSLAALAEEFSPRYEGHGDDLVSIDVSGLDRLIGPARTVGEELRREAAARGAARIHVALARTRTAAHILALARPGLTVVEPGGEAEALAPLPIDALEKYEVSRKYEVSSVKSAGPQHTSDFILQTFCALKRWGLRTLGELAALPSANLASRLGPSARVWQAIARGDEACPLVPTRPEERFDASLDLEWPIDSLEPLSFVLTRLLEPLSTRLERRDRGVAILHVVLRLVTRSSTLGHAQSRPEPSRGPTSSGRDEPVEPREIYARRLELPAPIRDVRTLRALAILNLDAHPPPAAIDRVTIVIDPTPGRVLQHTLFARAHPTPEQLSTLLARLGALMGQDRVGRAATVDSYRPGAFEMASFATEHKSQVLSLKSASCAHPAHSKLQTSDFCGGGPSVLSSEPPVVSALRRCRQPVPARVATDGTCRPVRVTTDRRGFVGGSVVHCAGPWRTSGEWWKLHSLAPGPHPRRELTPMLRSGSPSPRSARHPSAAAALGTPAWPQALHSWDRDEWDVALTDGAIYRIFHDRETDRWFIDAVVD